MAEEKSTSLVVRVGQKFGVDPDKLLVTLKRTAFNVKGAEVTNEQMMALLVVAEKYDLNPFVNQIYAFPTKGGGIAPVVGVDGWITILNRQPQLDGYSFEESEKMKTMPGAKSCPEWMEVKIVRKDRSEPIIHREYLEEVYRPPITTKEGHVIDGHWQTHTKRMLKWKTLIQGGRLAFGLTGIYDQDEAERIGEGRSVEAEIVEAAAQIEDAEAKFADLLQKEGVTFNDWADLAIFLEETATASGLQKIDLIKNLLITFTADENECEAFLKKFSAWRQGRHQPTEGAAPVDPAKQKLIRDIDEMTAQVGFVEAGEIFKKHGLEIGKLAGASMEALTKAQGELNQLLDKQLEQ